MRGLGSGTKCRLSWESLTVSAVCRRHCYLEEKQIPLHTSERAGLSGTLFFFASGGCWPQAFDECGAGLEGVLLAASVGRTLSPSASVVVLLKSDFLGLLLLAPVRGGTSFLFKREKKRSKETRFKPPIFKCRRCSLQVFGTNVARPPNINPQSNTHPQAQTARTRFASTAAIAATVHRAPPPYGQRSRHAALGARTALTVALSATTRSRSVPTCMDCGPVACCERHWSARALPLAATGIGAVEAKRVRAVGA